MTLRDCGHQKAIPIQGDVSGQLTALPWQYLKVMALAHSKLTAQGQISVPAKVRKKLGVGPGSVLEWDDDGEQIVVRRAGRFSSDEVHRSLFAVASEA